MNTKKGLTNDADAKKVASTTPYSYEANVLDKIFYDWDWKNLAVVIGGACFALAIVTGADVKIGMDTSGQKLCMAITRAGKAA